MKAYDMINKQELDLDRKALIDLMLHDRQVDLAFDQVRSDADGYLSWDAENWSWSFLPSSARILLFCMTINHTSVRMCWLRWLSICVKKSSAWAEPYGLIRR